jgi:hypothetical protein
MVYLGVCAIGISSYVICSKVSPTRILLRYHLFPAVVAVFVWFLPLLAFGAYAFAYSNDGPPALGAGVALFLCLLGSPIPFAWLICLRRRWMQRSDVRKIQLFGIPAVLGALPGWGLAFVFFVTAHVTPHGAEAITILLFLFALTVALLFLGIAGAAAWYKLAYECV